MLVSHSSAAHVWVLVYNTIGLYGKNTSPDWRLCTGAIMKLDGGMRYRYGRMDETVSNQFQF